MNTAEATATTETRPKGPPPLPGGLTPLLKPSELAAYYSVALSTVNQWVKDGCPIAKRLPNGDRRFRLADVDAWLDKRSAGVEEITTATARRLVAARTV